MKRTPVRPEEIATLAKAARLPLTDARQKAMPQAMDGVFELLDTLDQVELGETSPAIAYRAKWEGGS